MPKSASLEGLSVLVLEDDFYIAEDSKAVLEDAGATVLGPYSESAEALAEATARGADCALVDVNLGSGPSFAPARGLMQLGVPVILMTGYDDSVMPEAFAKVPCLQKPIQPRKIVAAVAKACGRQG